MLIGIRMVNVGGYLTMFTETCNIDSNRLQVIVSDAKRLVENFVLHHQKIVSHFLKPKIERAICLQLVHMIDEKFNRDTRHRLLKNSIVFNPDSFSGFVTTPKPNDNLS